jgi:hypothetical protein
MMGVISVLEMFLPLNNGNIYSRFWHGVKHLSYLLTLTLLSSHFLSREDGRVTEREEGKNRKPQQLALMKAAK